MNKKYDNPAKPFELWNIGNYETVYWQERKDEYLAFMLKLYQTTPVTMEEFEKYRFKNIKELVSTAGV